MCGNAATWRRASHLVEIASADVESSFRAGLCARFT
jgi:hypothetical protein